MSDNDFFGGRRRRRAGAAFSPYSLFASGEQGVWYDPSDLTPEKVSWRRNLLTYSQDFENAAWTKSNASILSNLALYSQDFDNAAWAKTDITVTANTIAAPDGTLTADLLTAGVAGTDGCSQTPTSTANITHTLSFYAKRGNTDWLFMRFGDATNQVRGWWNLATGTAGTAANAGTATGATESIQDVGNGWYRCVLSGAVNGAVTAYAINGFCATADGSITRVNNSTRYMWGAQFVPGSTAQTYTRSLATAAPIQFADPLGGTLADKLVEDTSLVLDHRLVSATNTFAVGTTYTSSLYAKAAERSFVRIFVLHVASTSFTVNLADGSIQFQSNSGNVTASATLVDNGWYRIQYTYLVTVASASAPIYAVIAYNATGTVTGTGNGTSGLLIFGAQAEQASTASAYQRITDFSSDFLAAFPTHALFQESTGFTPVTALGQSVGFVLDKRLGGASNLGAELVSNGDFSNGSTGWTTTNWIVSGGAAEVINAIDSIAQNISLTAGKTYRVTYTVRSFSGTGGVRPRFFGGTTVTGTTVSSAGTFSEYLVAVTGNTQVAIASTSSTCAIIVDNISVREVPGNHAIQATSASRPTLQARSNLLTRTEEFDNAAWTNVGTPAVTANSTVAPDGTTTADTINDSSAVESQGRRQTLTIPGSTTTSYAGSVYILKTVGTPTVFPICNLRMTGGTTVDAYISLNTTTGETVTSGAASGSAVDAGAYWRVALTAANNGTANTSLLYTVFPAGATALTTALNVAATGSQVFWGAQIEERSTASTYQRVVTATDYADVGLPRNLTFDGVDDSLATAGNVDFSATDKVTLFSGLFKASDAAQGIVTELTASAALNTGAFNIQAPSATPGTNRYAFESKGSVLATANVTNAIYAAPRTDVVTMQSAISTDALDGRINGTSVATSATDQGTGNFSNALVYIGRRGGTTLPFNGRLFQLVIRGAATDSVTVGNAERWVGQLTGVAL